MPFRGPLRHLVTAVGFGTAMSAVACGSPFNLTLPDDAGTSSDGAVPGPVGDAAGGGAPVLDASTPIDATIAPTDSGGGMMVVDGSDGTTGDAGVRGDAGGSSDGGPHFACPGTPFFSDPLTAATGSWTEYHNRTMGAVDYGSGGVQIGLAPDSLGTNGNDVEVIQTKMETMTRGTSGDLQFTVQFSNQVPHDFALLLPSNGNGTDARLTLTLVAAEAANPSNGNTVVASVRSSDGTVSAGRWDLANIVFQPHTFAVHFAAQSASRSLLTVTMDGQGASTPMSEFYPPGPFDFQIGVSLTGVEAAPSDSFRNVSEWSCTN